MHSLHIHTRIRANATGRAKQNPTKAASTTSRIAVHVKQLSSQQDTAVAPSAQLTSQWRQRAPLTAPRAPATAA